MGNLIILGFTFRMGSVSLWWTVGLPSSTTLDTCLQLSTWTPTWWERLFFLLRLVHDVYGVYGVIHVFSFLLTDAPEPLWICPLCEVPLGGSETVSRVRLHRQRRAPVLHGQWARGGGHVHEHGAGPFPAGEGREGSYREHSLQHEVLMSLLIKAFLLQKNKEYVSIAKGGFMGE